MNHLRYLANVVTLAYDESKCTGCGRCSEVCPHGVFASNGSKAFITDRDLCIECAACMMNCAFGAINVRKGVGCAAAVLSSKLKKGGEVTCGCGGDEGGCCS
jgi:NAD-dependent dihydropyrimidine dehydrogenase PreA subunit